MRNSVPLVMALVAISVAVVAFIGGFVSGASFVLSERASKEAVSLALPAESVGPAAEQKPAPKSAHAATRTTGAASATSGSPIAHAVVSKPTAPPKPAPDTSGKADQSSAVKSDNSTPPPASEKNAADGGGQVAMALNPKPTDSTNKASSAGRASADAAKPAEPAPTVASETADSTAVAPSPPKLLVPPAEPASAVADKSATKGTSATAAAASGENSEPKTSAASASEPSPPKDIEVSMPTQDNVLAQPLPPPAPAPPVPAFTLQYGAFLDVGNARQAVALLDERGYSAYILESVDQQQRVWHRVRFGQYRTEGEARSKAAEFRKQEGMTPALVREPPPKQGS